METPVVAGLAMRCSAPGFGEEYELSLSPGNSPLFHLRVFQSQRPIDSSIKSSLRTETLSKKLGRFLAAVCPIMPSMGMGFLSVEAFPVVSFDEGSVLAILLNNIHISH